MEAENIKEETYRILDALPEKATWDDLMHSIYVRQAIEAGIKDSDAGRTDTCMVLILDAVFKKCQLNTSDQTHAAGF